MWSLFYLLVIIKRFVEIQKYVQPDRVDGHL